MEEIVRLQGTVSEQRSRIQYLEGESERARALISERNEMELQITRLRGELNMYQREAKQARKKKKARRRGREQSKYASESSEDDSEDSEDDVYVSREIRRQQELKDRARQEQDRARQDEIAALEREQAQIDSAIDEVQDAIRLPRIKSAGPRLSTPLAPEEGTPRDTTPREQQKIPTPPTKPPGKRGVQPQVANSTKKEGYAAAAEANAEATEGKETKAGNRRKSVSKKRAEPPAKGGFGGNAPRDPFGHKQNVRAFQR